MSNDTGADRTLSISTAINGERFDTNTATIIDGDILSLYHTQVVSFAGVAGSTITLGAICWLVSGSTTNHNGNVRWMLVGQR